MPSGRIYIVYGKATDMVDRSKAETALMACRYSDDAGQTWSQPIELPFRRSPIDNPDVTIPSNWIAWRQPEFDREGRVLVTFTRWASPQADVPLVRSYSQCELMRFENLAENPEPEDIRITWLPEGEPITVPSDADPAASFAQEASVVPLPDDRLFMVMRTDRGQIWYTVSENEGKTWRAPEPLCYQDEGEFVLQPVSPSPLFRLQDGRFLLLYNNNDGFAHGATKRWDPKVMNRRPAYLAVGAYRPTAYQPIWFSPPKMFIDNDAVPMDIVGNVPRYDAAAYPSLTEVAGERVLWYPDRKHFLLGKRIPDSFLSDMQILPQGNGR